MDARGVRAFVKTLGRSAGHRSQQVWGASRAATATEHQQEYLFVQTFSSGAWEPKAGQAGTYDLTLTGQVDRTVCFSDRPAQVAGVVSTAQFLDGLGFSLGNPPNAAVVAQTPSGEHIVIAELLDPNFTADLEPDGEVRVTYVARVLDGYQEDGGLGHLAERQTVADLPETFGPASLFIDDCPDITDCFKVTSLESEGPVPGGPYGRCWNWSKVACVSCSHPEDPVYYERICNQTYDDCHGNCTAR